MRYYFKNGNLILPSEKTLYVNVEMFVETIDDDPFKEIINPKEFVNGVKITGEISFEQTVDCKNKLLPNTTAYLKILDGDKGSSFNILLTEQTGESDILPKKLKRYFWSFLPIGDPEYDKLEIFPVQYKRPNKINRIYYLSGYEKTILIVAQNKKEAYNLILNSDLDQQYNILNLQELDTNNSGIKVLDKRN